MNIDQNVLDRLSQIAKVNPQILIRSDEIAVASGDKKCIVYWKWDQTVETMFGIYDMNHFLNVMKLHTIEDVTVTEETTNVKIKSSSGENTYKLEVEDLNDIFKVPPTKNDFFTKRLTDQPAELTMKADLISVIKKQYNVLSCPHLVFEQNEIILNDCNDSSMNTYRKEIVEDKNIARSVILASMFCIMETEDYNVKVFENAVIFENNARDICYVHAKLDI